MIPVRGRLLVDVGRDVGYGVDGRPSLRIRDASWRTRKQAMTPEAWAEEQAQRFKVLAAIRARKEG